MDRNLTLIIFLIGCFIGCNKPIQYSKSLEITEPWGYQDTIQFTEIPIKSPADINLSVYHTPEYGYENLYLNTTITSESDTLYNDVFSIDLLEGGFWKGKNLRGLYEVNHKILRISSAESYSLKLTVNQYSREPALSGIKKLEVVVKSPEQTFK